MTETIPRIISTFEADVQRIQSELPDGSALDQLLVSSFPVIVEQLQAAPSQESLKNLEMIKLKLWNAGIQNQVELLLAKDVINYIDDAVASIAVRANSQQNTEGNTYAN